MASNPNHSNSPNPNPNHSNSANPNIRSNFDEAMQQQQLLWGAGSSQQSAPMGGQTTAWVHHFQARPGGGNAGQTSQAMVDLDLQLGLNQWPPLQQQLSQPNSPASAQQQRQQLNAGSLQQSALMGEQVSGHLPMLPGDAQSNQFNLLAPLLSQPIQKTNVAQIPQSVLGNNSGQTLQGMQPIGAMGSLSPNSQLGTNGSFLFPKPAINNGSFLFPESAINNGQVKQQQLSQQNSLDSTQVIGTTAALGLNSQCGTNGYLSYGQQAINNGQFRQQQLSQQNSLDSPLAQGLPSSSSLASTLTQNGQPTIIQNVLLQQQLLQRLNQMQPPISGLGYPYSSPQQKILQQSTYLHEQLQLQQLQLQQLQTQLQQLQYLVLQPNQQQQHSILQQQQQLTRRPGTGVLNISNSTGSEPEIPASSTTPTTTPVETSTHGTKENKKSLTNKKNPAMVSVLQQQLTRRSGAAVQKSSNSTESQLKTPASGPTPTTTLVETSTNRTEENKKGLSNQKTLSQITDLDIFFIIISGLIIAVLLGFLLKAL